MNCDQVCRIRARGVMTIILCVLVVTSSHAITRLETMLAIHYVLYRVSVQERINKMSQASSRPIS